MKNRIILSGVLFVVMGLLVGGGTFAYFSSTDTNTADTFTAGTVTIAVDRNNGDSRPGPMFYTNNVQGAVAGAIGINPTGEWRPGDTRDRSMHVENDGSLNAKITRIQAVVTGLDDEAYEEFISNMKIRVDSGNNHTVVTERTLANYLGDGAPVIAPATDINATKVMANSYRDLTFVATLDINAGNALQGTSPVVSFIVTAEQDTNH